MLQVGMGQMDCYERDFEEPMLKATADYYRRKAAVWVQVRLGLAGQVDETRRVWHWEAVDACCCSEVGLLYPP